MKNLLTLASVLAVLLSTQTARAQSTWVPTSGSNSWSVSGNWSGGVPNGQGAIANVTSAATANTTATLGGTVTLGTLHMGATSGNFAFSIAPGTGGLLKMDNGGSGALIAESSFNSGDTISSAISMADANSLTALTITSTDVTGKTFILSGGITSTTSGSNLLIDDNGAGGITFSTNLINNQGTISNAGTGAGTVNISGGVGSNVTAVMQNSSTSILTISGALATAASGTTTLGSTATGSTAQFQITGGITGSGNLNINNTGSESSATGAILISTGTVSTTGTITNLGTGSGVEITAAITAASGVIENGASSLYLGGANTYTGNTVLQSGEIIIGSTTALGATSSTFIINGGSIDVTSGSGTTMVNNNAQLWNANFAWLGTKPLTFGTGTITLGGNVTLTAQTHGSLLTENGAILGTGTLTINDNDNNSGLSVTLAGTVNNAGAIINSGTSTGTTTISGNIGSNVGLITENSAGSALILSGTNTNTNGVLLTAGTLDINSSTALGATASTLTIAAGTIDNKSGASLTLVNNNAQNWNGSFTFSGTNSLNLGTGAVTLGGTSTPTITVSANTLTEGGVIGGSFGLIKAGTGTLVLSGLSTYTGTTTVSAGTLSINSIQNGSGGGASALGNPNAGNNTITLAGGTLQYTGSSLGSSNRAINLTNASALDASGLATFALSGGITGSNKNLTLLGTGLGSESSAIATGTGSVTKLGTGTWTLSGTNTYTGATVINAGTLMVNGSLASGSAVTVNNGGTLAGTGTAAGSVTVASGGSVNLGDNTIGTLTVGSLSIGNAATTSGLVFEIGTSSNIDSISVSGNLTFTGASGTSITIENLNNVGSQSIVNGTYNLISYAGSLSGALSNITLMTTTLDGHTLTLTSLGSGELVLTVSGGAIAPTVAYFNGAGSDLNAAADYDTTGSSATALSASVTGTTNVYFSADRNTSNAASASAALAVNSLNFGVGAGTNSGMTVSGPGVITITGSNVNGNTGNQGITTTGSGNNTISAPIALAASQAWSVDTGGTLTVSGTVSGAGMALTKSGAGKLVLTGNNTYSGGTTISAGTLAVNNASGSATGTGSLQVNSGATLSGTGTINATNITVSGTVNVGNGGTTDVLTMTASGTTNFTNANLTFNLSADTPGNSSTLALGSTSSVLFGNTSLTLNLVGNSAITTPTGYLLFSSTATTDVFSGLTLSGNIITGGLTLTLTGPNAGNYSGSYLMLVSNGLGGDNIVAVVPEPGTWTMMLSGLALLLIYQRSRRSKIR